MTSFLPSVRRWRLPVSGASDGATNMAIDHSLARCSAATEEAIARVYAWAPATVSFGRNRRARRTTA